jgi:hypothetical protein
MDDLEIEVIRMALLHLMAEIAEAKPATILSVAEAMRDTARMQRRDGKAAMAARIMTFVSDMEDLIPPPAA